MISKAPAFLYGVIFLIGIASALAFHPVYCIPLMLCLWRTSVKYGFWVFALGFGWASLLYTLPKLPEKGVECEGVFQIQSLSYSHSPFQKSLLYKGHLKGPFSRSVPCHLYFKEEKPHPTANTALQVKGLLMPKGNHHYLLKLSSWKPLPHSRSLAQARFNFKNHIRSNLAQYFPDSKSRAFSLSMLTGEIDDQLLALEFNRIGILHLLGISGFQFTLLAFLLGTLLRFVMPYKAAYPILMLFLSAYTFILGDSPPIERAWVASMLYFSALLFNFRISPLNALGVALLWQLIKDPLLIFHLGFQFSFLCTAAILLVYPLLRSFLFRAFACRSFKETLRLPFLDQHGHLLSFFFRETLALNLAIHVVTLPLILTHFHKFPLLSLIYNLFLPAAASLVYFLLILGIVLGPWLLTLTGKFSAALLQVATHPPALYDFQWRVHDFPLSAAIVAMTLIFYLAISKASSIEPSTARSR